MNKEEKTINLLDNVPNAKKLFALSGRSLGKTLRLSTQLNEIEDKYKKVIINIDDHIIFLSSSFFLGMFGESVRKCETKERFKEKFEFKVNKEVIPNIEDGINDALNNINPLV